MSIILIAIAYWSRIDCVLIPYLLPIHLVFKEAATEAAVGKAKVAAISEVAHKGHRGIGAAEGQIAME